MPNSLSLLLGAGPQDNLYIGHSAEDVFFHILFSHYLHHVRETGKNHFLLAKPQPDFLPRLGCFAKTLPQGVITSEILESLFNPRVSLLSLPWADPLTGLIHPLHEIADFCREKEILLHVDITAAIGRIDFRIQDIAPMYCSLENAVFTSQPVYMPALPAELLTTLTKNVEQRLSAFDRMVTEVARLRDMLEAGIGPLADLPFQSCERVPDIATFSLPYMHADLLCFLLHQRQIPAHVVDDHTVSLRLAPTIDEEHIHSLIAILKECIYEPA